MKEYLLNGNGRPYTLRLEEDWFTVREVEV